MTSYPVVNSSAAVGQRTILRSEILALRSDLRTLTAKGVLTKDGAHRIGASGDLLSSPGGLGGGNTPRGDGTQEYYNAKEGTGSSSEK